jgi:hypothetical protein
MGLKGRAAVTGVADYKNVRKYTGKRKFYLEQWAELTQWSLLDAGSANTILMACVAQRFPSPPCLRRRSLLSI